MAFNLVFSFLYHNFIFSSLIINILLVNIINSYYIFPFKVFKPNLSDLYKIHSNLSKEEIFLNYTNSISIYTLIKIDDSRIYEMFFQSRGKCSFLTNDSCISNINNFPKQTHINTNISKIFEEIENNSKYIIPNKCMSGIIGLALPGYTSKSTCLPIINEIKENDNTIKSQVWSIKYYNSSENKDYDGEIIIGIEPHGYEPSIYKESDYFTIYNHISEDYYNDEWAPTYIAFSLEFEKVYFYNGSTDDIIEMTTSYSKEAELEFDLGMIKCPFVYLMLIKTHFFQDYIDSNVCQEIEFSENYYTFVCDKNKLNIKVEEFYKLYPSIYFFSVHLNYTFSLKGEDLFLEKDDKLYYLIFSKNENVNNWRLGQIFLKKYYFTFNQEKKQIGFYIKNLKEEKQENAENNNNTNNDNKINYNVIILIVVVILLIFEIGFAIYCVNKKCLGNNRRKRANELTDDNYDYLSINKN